MLSSGRFWLSTPHLVRAPYSIQLSRLNFQSARKTVSFLVPHTGSPTRTMSKKRARASSPIADEGGTGPASNSDWPASRDAMAAARAFIQSSATTRSKTLLVPDKDADGLCGTMIIYRTLLALGLPRDRIQIHFIAKGSNVHRADERERMEACDASYVVVVDQGSRKSGPIVRGEGVRTLVVDHHWSTDFPEGVTVLSAAQHPPIATSSALAYMLCKPLMQGISAEADDLSHQIDYLCAIGTYGDLGTSFTFLPPWPQEGMKRATKKWTKKCLTDAVGLLNAPRRTATYDVVSAWNALETSPPPIILKNARLHAARAEVNSEINRSARNRPWFSGDGRVALVRVTSGAQIHPVIATRWTSTLKSGTLEIVMCANDGYLPEMTNFSCRVAKCAKERLRGTAAGSEDEQAGSGVNIIELLKEYAGREPGLLESMGDDFARGHKEASGGIVRTEDFERLWNIMQKSEAAEGPPRKKRKTEATQKNTLDSWIKKG